MAISTFPILNAANVTSFHLIGTKNAIYVEDNVNIMFAKCSLHPHYGI